MSVKMNYKDDMFFGNRRYNMQNNSDGTVSLEDVTQYQQVGDSFGAGDMNKMASEINGFTTKKTEFKDDGSVVETDAYGNVKTTTFSEDGSVLVTLHDTGGELIATKKIIFSEDGKTVEEVLL